MAQQPTATAESHERAPEVERSDDVPVGTQLAWRLRALIKSGRLEPGSKLPGIRELAGGASVNVNTARAVYRRLEREGLAVSRQGHGTFVADRPSVSPVLEQLAADSARAAREFGVEPRELARTLYASSPPEWSGAPDEHAPDLDEELDERGARESLRAQIARLEAELAAYPEARSAAGRRSSYPAVQKLGRLEKVRDELVERLRYARNDAEAQALREGDARVRLEEMVDDPAAHKWEAISNEDLGDPGCRHWQVRPAWGPVGAIMNWWRVKISSGCP